MPPLLRPIASVHVGLDATRSHVVSLLVRPSHAIKSMSVRALVMTTTAPVLSLGCVLSGRWARCLARCMRWRVTAGRGCCWPRGTAQTRPGHWRHAPPTVTSSPRQQTTGARAPRILYLGNGPSLTSAALLVPLLCDPSARCGCGVCRSVGSCARPCWTALHVPWHGLQTDGHWWQGWGAAAAAHGRRRMAR